MARAVFECKKWRSGRRVQPCVRGEDDLQTQMLGLCACRQGDVADANSAAEMAALAMWAWRR
jgi:hypothetical protein